MLRLNINYFLRLVYFIKNLMSQKLTSDQGQKLSSPGTSAWLSNKAYSPAFQFNQIHPLVAVIQPDGKLVAVNQSGVGSQQRDCQQGVQELWGILGVSAATETQLQKAIASAVQGHMVHQPIHDIGDDGTARTLDLTIQPLYDNQGQVSCLFVQGQVNRVTDTAWNQGPFLQLQTALGPGCAIALFELDLQGNWLAANDVWYQMTGLTPEQAQGQGWKRILHPQDQLWVETEMSQSLQRGEPFWCEFRCRRSDQRVIWVVSQGQVKWDHQGRAIAYTGTMLEITERKQAELALKESERRFRVTFEQAAVGIAHISLEGQWLRVNQRLCDIVGYTRTELLELTFQDITHPDDLATDLLSIKQLLNGEIERIVLEKRYIHKQGTLVWVNVTVSLIREETSHKIGQPLYLIGVVEEIGRRKQTERFLQERAQELADLNRVLSRTTALLHKRNQELDQFAYVASHDLKAPLRAIANLSEWIEEDLADILPAENQHQMHLLRGRVRRMEALIEGLLQYSRIGRTQTPTEVFSLQELIADVIDSLDPPSTFTISIPPHLPVLKTKRLLLRQVFANLISNALKHHPRRDGRIEIQCHATHPQGLAEGQIYYEFAVGDDGIGIDPQYHEKIFTIFQTLEARDQTENTGIGLSIVKKIVETEGGTIRLESRLGTGAIFRFTWPQHSSE